MGTRGTEDIRVGPKHCVNIDARSCITLCGIEEVISYDEESIVMLSNMGQLTLDGEGLNIVKLNLDEGDVCISGKLNALYYMEQQKKGGFMSRFFG